MEGGGSRYLFRGTDGRWRVGSDLRGDLAGIRSTLESYSVPSEGWECWGGGQWLQDTANKKLQKQAEMELVYSPRLR